MAQVGFSALVRIESLEVANMKIVFLIVNHFLVLGFAKTAKEFKCLAKADKLKKLKCQKNRCERITKQHDVHYDNGQIVCGLPHSPTYSKVKCQGAKLVKAEVPECITDIYTTKCWNNMCRWRNTSFSWDGFQSKCVPTVQFFFKECY